MSTSLLYHGFGIRGYEYLSAHYVEGQVVFAVRRSPNHLRCPVCGSQDVVRRGQSPREFRSLPIGRKKVKVIAHLQRVECRSCGAGPQQERIPFADPKRQYTHAFERYAVELSRHMTIQDVARHLGVSWDVIKDIQKRYLSRRFGRPKLKRVRLLAIDEISVGHGHRYLTVALNLESGAVVFVGEGKDSEALKPFWKRLKASGARVKAVAMDMSPAYQKAVSEALPNAQIVFDRFHLMKLFNAQIDELRREMQREAREKLHKEVLKGTRWILLKNSDHLDKTRNERERLEEALRINKPLATAYYLKEDLRQLWEQKDKAAAKTFLQDWIARAETSGIQRLKKFARTLAIHRSGILAWYDYRISTGALEGTNNKIQTMKRQAYGFRDMDFFKLKILGIHETKYALVG